MGSYELVSGEVCSPTLFSFRSLFSAFVYSRERRTALVAWSTTSRPQQQDRITVSEGRAKGSIPFSAETVARADCKSSIVKYAWAYVTHRRARLARATSASLWSWIRSIVSSYSPSATVGSWSALVSRSLCVVHFFRDSSCKDASRNLVGDVRPRSAAL